MFRVNNKNTRTSPMTFAGLKSFLLLYILYLNDFDNEAFYRKSVL